MKRKEIMTNTLITSASFNRRRSGLFFYSLLLAVLLVPCFMPVFTSASEQLTNTARANAVDEINRAGEQALIEGKNSMGKGDYQKSIALLTAAYEKLPLLGDYALLWRSRAYEGNGDRDKALEDLKTITEKYKESPLVKKARLIEIDLMIKKNDPSVGGLLEAMIKDSPSNMEIKYSYAQYLKENNNSKKAKELFREVFISACPMSANASNELSPSDITVGDLLKRGKALNAAWQFEEAEKVLREALTRSDNHRDKNEITDSLAYSLFSQKRYKEAAALFKKTKNSLWRARSLFRAGDIDDFQAELPEFSKTADKRIAGVMIAYGSLKRRQGNSDEAIKIFNNVLSRYPSAREDVLWATGWTYYLSRDYKNASRLFSQLAQTYGDSKYLYWSQKCRELLGNREPLRPPADRENFHDFYAYLTFLKNKQEPPAISRTYLKASLMSPVAERVEILAEIGLTNEAAAELLLLSRKNPAPGDLISISSYLEKMGHYKSAEMLISKLPYNEELHELYYPLAFWPEVKEASEETSLDPYLILSVIREESRYEPEARSIAGAIGLMQLMPQTARRCNKNIKVHLKNSPELYDARTNIMLGSSYFRQLLNKLGSIPFALASYNGGEDAVRDWLKNGNYRTVDEFIEDIPYHETRNYVKKVLTTYFEYLRSNRDGGVSMAHTHIGEL
ncbi:MAG: transglycosylase SLT domain-containing protein [Dissulfurispiraceae bacterium]